jgi:hypothetical protein
MPYVADDGRALAELHPCRGLLEDLLHGVLGERADDAGLTLLRHFHIGTTG